MWRVALFALAALPLGAAAQRNLAVESTEQRVALVIGNAAYRDSPLANPVNDATDVASALRRFGFKVILRRNAGTREMRQAIREFGGELRRAEVGLFYFAGHGVQVRGNNYLVPVGADIQSEADAEDLAIDANYALRTMEEAQVKVSIVILDACRNNPFARGFRSGARGLAQMNAATGSVIAFSTAPGSVAADGSGRNGTYTKHLLASLRQPDTDLLKVFQRARANVVKETAGKQTPWESTSLIGDFYFRPPAAAGAPAAHNPAAIELAFWASIKDSTNAEELRAYLEQYPKGLFSSLARTRLKALDRPADPPPQEALPEPSSDFSSLKVEHLQGFWKSIRDNTLYRYRIEGEGETLRILVHTGTGLRPWSQLTLNGSSMTGTYVRDGRSYAITGEVGLDRRTIQLQYESEGSAVTEILSPTL